MPLQIPPLRARTRDLPRIIEEYALDAINELGADEAAFTRADRDWVIARSASTLPEIEKGPRRLVALRQEGSIHRAAMRLGISHVGRCAPRSPPSWCSWRATRGSGRESR